MSLYILVWFLFIECICSGVSRIFIGKDTILGSVDIGYPPVGKVLSSAGWEWLYQNYTIVSGSARSEQAATNKPIACLLMLEDEIIDHSSLSSSFTHIVMWYTIM